MLKPFAAVAVIMTVATNVAQAQTAAENTPSVVPAPQIAAPVAPSLDAPSLAAPAIAPAPNLQETLPASASDTVVPTASDASEAVAPETATETAPIAAENETTPDASDAQPVEAAPVEPADLKDRAQDAYDKAFKFLKDGGPSIWAIAALAVITLALILWKIWRLALMGAWSRGKAGRALNAYERGDYELALKTVQRRRGVRSRVLTAGLIAIDTLPEPRAREEVARIAKGQIATARTGLGALELISTIAPLLGLLGTVLGMIAAFQALQAAGSKADPALLAGGIWEALLTTAAGMGVAIPASAALTWFESVIDRIRRDIEDGATRLFVAFEPEDVTRLAAE